MSEPLLQWKTTAHSSTASTGMFRACLFPGDTGWDGWYIVWGIEADIAISTLALAQQQCEEAARQYREELRQEAVRWGLPVEGEATE